MAEGDTGLLSVLVLMIVGAVWWNARPSPDRARLRVQGFEVLPPVAERPIQVNVFFRNIGEAAADVRVFYVSAVRGFPVSAQEQINIETELRDGVEKIVSEGRNIDLRVAPGQGAWYTISGTGVTADWVEKFNKGQLAVSFAGAFFYTDPAGEHSTHFCAYSDTRPQITFICKQGNDEN